MTSTQSTIEDRFIGSTAAQMLRFRGPTVKPDFPSRLRELRRSRNLSQSDLAKMVGLHYNHIGRYERGSSQPSADALGKLAEALGVSTDYLFEGDTGDAARADFEDRELLAQFQRVQQLPEEDKIVIKKLVDAFLTKQQLQKMVAGT